MLDEILFYFSKVFESQDVLESILGLWRFEIFLYISETNFLSKGFSKNIFPD